MKTIVRWILLTSMVLSSLAIAEEADPHAQDRLQLRSILEESQRGINTQEISLFTKHIAPEARVTFLNGEVVQGPQGVQDYFRHMVGNDPNAVLSQYQTKADVVDLARFYGADVAVANGTMHDVFTPKARGVFEFDSKWSATFAKQDGVWKIVSLHFSTNAFNNALTDELKEKIKQSALLAALTVAVVMLAVNWLRRRKAR
jgi:hypothetical protein